MNVLDLFSGIGGFSLGLERAGMRTVAFCEIKPFARRVLAERWPLVPCYPDVRELTAARLHADGIAADVICGGFPCQDISSAGTGAGINGARSGLWSEYARLIGELRPRYVIVENVAALLGRGLGRVLGDLAALGYDAEWDCLPASAIGAPHRRDRVWIIAHPNDQRELQSQRCEQDKWGWSGNLGQDVADAISERGCRRFSERQDATYADTCREIIGAGAYGEWWAVEPRLGRVAHGIPNRAHRLRQLGNAVVPQIPEIIGRAIMKAVAETDANAPDDARLVSGATLNPQNFPPESGER